MTFSCADRNRNPPPRPNSTLEIDAAESSFSFQIFPVYEEESRAGGEEGQAVGNGLRVKSHFCSQEHGQDGGGQEIGTLAEKGKEEGKPGHAQGSQGVHKDVLEA